MKKVTLILKANVQNDVNEKLLAGLLDDKNIRLHVYVQGENKELISRLSKKKITVKKWPDTVFILPEKSKPGAIWTALKNAPFIFSFLKTETPDCVISTDMSILCALSPFCFIVKTKLLWVQTSAWRKFPAATLLAGYTKEVIVPDENILNSLPDVLKSRARLVSFGSKDIKNILGCN